MSFLTYRASLLRQSLPLATRPAGSRAFGISARRAVLSEAEVHHEDRHGEIDHHKDDMLKKQKEGKGHWKRELASQSEAAIKADREEAHASEESIKELQKETEEIIKETNHSTNPGREVS